MHDHTLEALSKADLLMRIQELEAENTRLQDHRNINLIGEALENVSEAIVIYDGDGGLQAWNKNFQELYGYKDDELKIGIHFSELGKIDVERGNVAIGDECGGGEAYLARKAEYRRKLEGSFIVRLKDGRWIKTTDRATRHGGFVSVQVDVTEIKKLEEKMRFMAQHDPLTKIPNRYLFMEKSEVALSRAKRTQDHLAALFIDIDGFKAVNDSMGHWAGDQLLQFIVQRLKGRLRESDLLARLGGDEFVVLLSQDVKRGAVQKVAQYLIDELAAPFAIEGKPISISASVGISYYPEHGENIDSLLHKADIAMYAAKRAGKNQWSECP